VNGVYCYTHSVTAVSFSNRQTDRSSSSCGNVSQINLTAIFTFSFSVPSRFRSSRPFNLPGASDDGNEEWKINNLPERPADLSASRPACMTGPSTTSVCRLSLNTSAIWVSSLMHTHSTACSFNNLLSTCKTAFIAINASDQHQNYVYNSLCYSSFWINEDGVFTAIVNF